VGDYSDVEDNTAGALSWEWMFGETGAIDSREKKARYKYEEPGNKTIHVIVKLQDGKQTFEESVSIKVQATKKKDDVSRIPADEELAKYFNLITKGDPSGETRLLSFCKSPCKLPGEITVDLKSQVTKKTGMSLFKYCKKLNADGDQVKVVKVTTRRSGDCIESFSIVEETN